MYVCMYVCMYVPSYFESSIAPHCIHYHMSVYQAKRANRMREIEAQEGQLAVIRDELRRRQVDAKTAEDEITIISVRAHIPPV